MKQSHKVREKIIEIAKTDFGYQKAFSYLRKVDPFVFEELILSCIENNNIRVFRNTKYTGDGGSDGSFKIRAGNVLIQCKRYGSHINPQHIEDFTRLVNNKRAVSGLFVHTGKTGKLSKEILKQNRRIILLSGEKLIDVITEKTTMMSFFKKVEHHQEQKRRQIAIKKFEDVKSTW